MKVCFFCGKNVGPKEGDEEHIFPDSFLGDHSLKNEKLNLLDGTDVTYSRVKVAAHKKCNNEFGSRYESRVLKILRNIPDYADELRSPPELPNLIQSPSTSANALLTTWFAKLFFGMIWFEAHRVRHGDSQTQASLREMLSGLHFEQVQRAYQLEKGFYLPSSTYYFRLKTSLDVRFDQGSILEPPTYWMKIGEHFFMSALGDGMLCYRYLNQNVLDQMRHREETGAIGPYFYLLLLAHLIAVRSNLPKSASYVIGPDFIMNTSLMTLSSKSFEIDGNKVNADALNLFQSLRGRPR